MGNTCAIGQSPNHPKNPVTATHAPDSYPGREMKGCDEGSYTKNNQTIT